MPPPWPADTEGLPVKFARANPRNIILPILSSHGKSYRVVGHAIVSADGMIADAQGLMPAPLRNDADWAIFQAALDRSSLVVLGSLGHGRHPNPGRRRLVFTSSVEQFAPDAADPLATLYNPAGLPVGELLERLDVPEGVVAVTGGRRVFDHFLPFYDEFMLAEVEPFVLPGGISCFGAGHPRAVLAAAGLAPFERQAIDPDNGVTLTRWQRPGGWP